MKRILFLIAIVLALTTSAQESQQSRYLLPEFTTSVARMKNGSFIRERFNYNCESQQVEFIDDSGNIMMMEGAMLIDTLKLGSHNLTPYKEHFIDRQYISDEFVFFVDYHVRVVEDGKVGAMGFKTHAGVQQVSRAYYDQAAQGGQTAGHIEGSTYTHDNTPLASIDVTATKRYYSYVVDQDGKRKTFKDEKSLLKSFPAQKTQLSAYLEENKVHFNHPEEVLDMLKVCINANSSK